MMQFQWQVSHQKRPREKIVRNSEKGTTSCPGATEGICFSHLKTFKRERVIEDELSQISQGWQSRSVKRQTAFLPCWPREYFEHQLRQDWRELEHTLASLQRGFVGYSASVVPEQTLRRCQEPWKNLHQVATKQFWGISWRVKISEKLAHEKQVIDAVIFPLYQLSTDSHRVLTN